MQYTIDDSLLTHAGRLELSRLLAMQAAGYAAREEHERQDQLQKEIDSRRRLTNEDVLAAALRDEEPYGGAQPKGKKGTVRLGDIPRQTVAVPTSAPAPAKAEDPEPQPQAEPAPRRNWWQRIFHL